MQIIKENPNEYPGKQLTQINKWKESINTDDLTGFFGLKKMQRIPDKISAHFDKKQIKELYQGINNDEIIEYTIVTKDNQLIHAIYS